jgi:hypothetical protein
MGTSDKRHGSNSNQALQRTAVGFIHAYELILCKDHRGVDLISDARFIQSEKFNLLLLLCRTRLLVLQPWTLVYDFAALTRARVLC